MVCMSAPERTYRGQSPATRRALRRQRLIHAGMQIFGTTGFHATTIKQLCLGAGLTERYFYESFPNREALFTACYDQALDALLELIIAALREASDQSTTSLAQTGLRAFFHALQQDHYMARILLVEIYGVSYDQERLFRQSIGRFSALVEQIALNSKTRAQATVAFDLELLATGLVGVCIQMAHRWVMEGFRHPTETLVANCMLIFSGLEDRLRA